MRPTIICAKYQKTLGLMLEKLIHYSNNSNWKLLNMHVRLSYVLCLIHIAVLKWRKRKNLPISPQKSKCNHIRYVWMIFPLTYIQMTLFTTASMGGIFVRGPYSYAFLGLGSFFWKQFFNFQNKTARNSRICKFMVSLN